MSRAINGCVEAVHDRHGVVTGERRRYDNRLSMAVLTRLDRLAAAQGGRDDQLRAVSEDLDDLLDVIEAGGDADAFVDARRPASAPEPPPPAPPPYTHRVENQWDQMASLLGCLDYKAMDPAQIDISDLPGPDLEGCEIEQYLRAHYSGYLAWVELVRRDAEEAGEDGDDLDNPDLLPRTYMRKLRACRRRVLDAQAEASEPAEAGGEAKMAAAGAAEPSTSST